MTSPTDIHSWLESVGLGDLSPIFEQNHITPDALEFLTADEIREMGISSLGQRKKLAAAIEALKASPIDQTPVTAVEEDSAVNWMPQLVPLKPASADMEIPHVHLPPVSLPRPINPIPSALPRPVIPVLVQQVVEPAPAAADPKYKRKAFSASFLSVSICLHLAVAIGAGYWVVQRIETKRKLQFAEGPPTASPSKRALEHKVSLQKKKNAGGSPAQARRIAVTGLASKITLPDMPSVPTTSTQFVAGRMAGMGGAGFGSGLGFGNGSGMGVGGAGAGGAGLTMFGARGGGGLVGTFYDLKQTKDRKPTDMAEGANLPWDAPQVLKYKEVVERFSRGWNVGVLDHYWAAPGKLATQQLFIPEMLAQEGPKAFEVEKDVRPGRWVVHYTGEIIAPKDGKFRFVGSCDDTLLVRCKSRSVLDGSLDPFLVDPGANESPNVGPAVFPFAPLRGGKWIEMRKNEIMKMEVLIGENPGGHFSCFLMIEESGSQHPSGIFPVFQLKSMDVPSGGRAPEHQGSIIFGSRATGSLLDSIKR